MIIMTKRMPGLDAIKIIATILIVFHHYQQITGAWWGETFFYSDKFYFGILVELFFIISGFLMYRYIGKIILGLSFKKFYIRRIMRFFPLMLTCVIVTTFFAHIYIILYGEVFFGINTYSLWTILISSIGVHAGWFATNSGINNPTWYISVLLLCYIIFYFLVYISEKLHISYNYFFIGMIIIGLSIQYYDINCPFLNIYSSRGYVAFFLGVLLAFIVNKYTFCIHYKMCMLIILSIPYLIYKQYWLVLKDAGYIMTFIFYPALIIIFSSKSVTNKLSWRWVDELAKISFNVFMWHFPLLLIMYVVIKLFKISVNLGTVKTMIAFTAICYLVGAISHYLIEKPINRIVDSKLKDWIYS